MRRSRSVILFVKGTVRSSKTRNVDALTQHDMVVLSSSHQRHDGQHDGQDRFDAPRIEPLNLSLIHRSEIPVPEG